MTTALDTTDWFCDDCRCWLPWMVRGTHTHCPHCNAPPSEQEVRNYSMIWHDGDVYCTVCETRVRTWDAG